MRITLVIPAMDAGGAQRVMAIMANHWIKRGWAVTILTLADGRIPPFFELDPRIKLVPLGITGDSSNIVAGLWKNLRRIYILRKAIRAAQSQVVISFIDQVNVLVLLATMGLDFGVIVSERIDPGFYRMGRVWGQLRWWVYSRAARIVVQSRGAGGYFQSKFKERLVIIANPVELPPRAHAKGCDDATASPSIVAVGRLCEQKRFDLLLRAFAKIKDQHPAWTLTILGEGPMRSVLESMCAQLGLKDRVYFPGFVKNVHRYLQQASLFVMSSYFEGFPNALCEAMASGLPVISTDCTSSLRDILHNEENGLLVPTNNEDALAAAMARLMGSETERQRFAGRAAEIAQRFSSTKIMAMWEEVLKEVVGKPFAYGSS